MAAPVTIERIGSEGDGIAHLTDGTPVYVRLTLPGEVVSIDLERPRGAGWVARAASIDAPAAQRVPAPCGAFGQCGGCVLQHWADSGYRDWKCGLLAAALRRAGFDQTPDIAYVPGLPGERRRMDFAVRRDRGQIVLGLHAAGSTEVVDLHDCLVLHPALAALLDPLRPAVCGLGAIRREASLVVNLLDAGPDVLLRTDAPLSRADRAALIEVAAMRGAPRLSWALGSTTPEPLCQFRPAATVLSGVEVRPPPGAFLQATRE
ncbi:MAG: class I SAM-dependent RNA methyltransferase, partial [Proteobacteria bacterium]|nr:class I SAM-dependent RNA methyltransferase [Pseudomonadota bacterium]